jgi:hypothetical protein
MAVPPLLPLLPLLLLLLLLLCPCRRAPLM